MKLSKNKKWNFNKNINKFPSHIRSSVPFYEEGHNLILDISEYFIHEKSNIYELGSSHGELSYKLANKYKHIKNSKFIGIDNSKEMVNYAKKNYKLKNLKFNYGDVVNFRYEKSDLFISYYTLQFLKDSKKAKFLRDIYINLKSGGCLIIFEKTTSNKTKIFQKFQNAYENFKLRNNLSIEEIYLKNKSLIGIMNSMEPSALRKLLKKTGFTTIELIFKCYFFEGYIVIKS